MCLGVNISSIGVSNSSVMETGCRRKHRGKRQHERREKTSNRRRRLTLYASTGVTKGEVKSLMIVANILYVRG